MMAAQLTLGKDSIVVGGVQKLFPGALMIAGAYDVFPDGQKFLLVEPAQCPFRPRSLWCRTGRLPSTSRKATRQPNFSSGI